MKKTTLLISFTEPDDVNCVLAVVHEKDEDGQVKDGAVVSTLNAAIRRTDPESYERWVELVTSIVTRESERAGNTVVAVKTLPVASPEDN